MIHLDNINIDSDQIDGYSLIRILIDDSSYLNSIADKIQKAKGMLPLFDDSGEYDPDNWYDFYLDVNVKELKVNCLYFEYGINGEYCDVIEIDDETKEYAMKTICEYYGGEDEYKKRLYKEGWI